MANPNTIECSVGTRSRGCTATLTPRQASAVILVGGDARELLRRLPAESVALVVTDPPYEFQRGRTYFRDWFPDLPDSEWPGVFRELFRVLQADAHLYVCTNGRTKPVFDQAAATAGFKVRVPLVWDKVSIGLGGLWRSQYEFVALYAKGKRPGNQRNRGNVLRAPRVHRGYPTEKPVALCRALIEQSSAPGELVLDPFTGSGSTGQAAAELGRRALLCDVTPQFASRRLGRSPRSIDAAVAAVKRWGRHG